MEQVHHADECITVDTHASTSDKHKSTLQDETEIDFEDTNYEPGYTTTIIIIIN